MMNQERSSRERRRFRERQRIKNEANEASYNSLEDNLNQYPTHTNKLTKKRKTIDVDKSAIDSEESSEVRPRDRSLRRKKSIQGSSKEEEEVAREDHVFKNSSMDDSLGKRRRKRTRKRMTGDRLQDKIDRFDRPVRTYGDQVSRVRSGEGVDIDRPRRKKNRSQDENGTSELPITELLKKAQKNGRTKYEEPIPLSNLTTDTLYVQDRNGFSAVKIGRRPSSRRRFESGKTGSHPIHTAIVAQKVWRSTGLVYQGLLGGIALMHFVVIQMFFSSTLEFVVHYASISEIYTNLFSFLAIMCVVAVLDKFDVAHLDADHLREIYANHSRSAITVPMYMAMFCLHQVTLKIDDKLSLTFYNNSMWVNDTTNLDVLIGELETWRRVTASKDILAVVAWIFLALGTRCDMLLVHLEAMEKYSDTTR